MAETLPLLAELRLIVGRRHVLTGAQRTRPYRTGYRFGEGAAVCVVRPGSLVEQWRVLKVCMAADAIVILQAANTGLTGGSTPDGDYDRDVVIVSTSRLARVHLIDEGRQVICLPGATLYQLERALRPLGREPHSVIGSSCLGASVVGGVCNNSGGALVQRGPAYTELALYAVANPGGGLRLVNHLGIALGEDPEAMLALLERKGFAPGDVDPAPERRGSDRDYARHVRDIEAVTPARFNADPRRLHEASGSAGRVAVFAVRLDTFPAARTSAVFYIGTNDPAELTELRRHILGRFRHLPVAAEYMHRDAFAIAAAYGKDLFLAIERFGTDRLPALARLARAVDRLARIAGVRRAGFSDRMLQWLARLAPQHLPARMLDYHARYEHHLMLKVADDAIGEMRAHLRERFPSAAGAMFECSAEEGAKAFLHRFVAAGAAVRYRAVHSDTVEDIAALDVALRRNDPDWTERLPEEIKGSILHALYYGHFLCHVFHQDYVIAKGEDPHTVEHAIMALLDRRGARYPAEHNVGHLYEAEPQLADFYRALDPGNRLNPGIGKTSRLRDWA